MARYNVIMAGKYRVGKSSLFGHLSRDPTKSLRGWDKFEHVVDLGSQQVQVSECECVSVSMCVSVSV